MSLALLLWSTTVALSIARPKEGELARGLAVLSCLYGIPLFYSIWYSVRSMRAMGEQESVPLTPPLLGWADHWFAVRWRALLTWSVLVAVAVEINQLGKMGYAIDWIFDQLRNLSNGMWFYTGQGVVSVATLHFLLTWFEPLALRLTFLRGLTWVGLRVVPYLLVIFVLSPYESKWFYIVVALTEYALLVPVLYRWRTRPWMCIVAGALSIGVNAWTFGTNLPLNDTLVYVIDALPFAATLLYGTQLLRPEGRVRIAQA